MKITYELDLNSFEAWSGAIATLERIRNADKCEELESLLEELYPDGMTETELNDLLWFDDERVFEWLGIRTYDTIYDELKEAEEELEELKENYKQDCEELAESGEDSAGLWEAEYADNAEELMERIEELKEELENI